MPKNIHPRLQINDIVPQKGMKPLVVELKAGEVVTPCVSLRKNEIYRMGFVVKKNGREIRFIGVPFDAKLHPSALIKILERDQDVYIRIKQN